jgi:uridine phosphorylase
MVYQSEIHSNNMAFPNFKNKHANDSMFSPKDYLDYQRKREKYDSFNPPEGVIFCYSKKLMEYVLENHKVTKVQRFYGEMYLFNETKGKVAIIGKFGSGAPVVVALLEELIAFGVKRFISIGTAGTLQKNINAGDLIVCERAIRDEGTSYHYLKASKYAYASKKMTERIKRALDMLGQKYFVGTSWTVDAPYRETVAEARQYQKEGVATVEMEASALFAVAQYRGVEMGAMFTVSDSLAELQWSPKFHFKKTKGGLEILYKVALATLLGKDSPPK